MRICKYCIRHKDGYCTMLKQMKADNDTCKLFEGYEAPATPPQQNKGVKGRYGIDWDMFLAKTARTMLPSFTNESEEIAAEKAVSYSKALLLKLKETLRQGY